MNLGLPYKGSKNLIAMDIIDMLPTADVFVDLFCGGCSMTHAAMLSGKYKRFILNDINPMCPTLFVDAVNGKFKDEKRWISREDFLASDEPYVKFCWSFGNNLKSYLYSNEIEPYKRACHYAIVFGEWNELIQLCPEVYDAAHNALAHLCGTKERRLAFGPAVVKRLKELDDIELVENNALYKSAHWRGGFPGKEHNDLQSLQSLERLQSLQSLESLESFSLDYREIKIPENSVVYCDIPYRGTDGYLNDFDHDAFFEWARKQPFDIYISEYNAPPDFHAIGEIEHRSRMSAIENKSVFEKIFCNHDIFQHGKMNKGGQFSLF